MALPMISRAIWICTLAVLAAALAPLDDLVDFFGVPGCPLDAECGNKDYKLHAYSCNSLTTPLSHGQADILEYRCHDGHCIAVEGLHNGIRNCQDGSDEAAPTTLAPTTTSQSTLATTATAIHRLVSSTIAPSTTQEESSMGPLVISVKAAKHLANMEWVPGDISDPYITVQIEGKPDTLIRSEEVDSNLNPEWNFRAVLTEYEEGDTLIFEVFDADPMQGDESMGKASLVLDMTPWKGDVLLDGTKSDNAFIEVKATRMMKDHDGALDEAAEEDAIRILDVSVSTPKPARMDKRQKKGSNLRKAGLQFEMVEAFKYADPMGHGRITRGALTRMFQHVGVNARRKHVERLFLRMDRDHDGSCSREEFFHLLEEMFDKAKSLKENLEDCLKNFIDAILATTTYTTTMSTAEPNPEALNLTTSTTIPQTTPAPMIKHPNYHAGNQLMVFPFLPWPSPPCLSSVRIQLAGCDKVKTVSLAPDSIWEMCAHDECRPGIDAPALPLPPTWPIQGYGCALPTVLGTLLARRRPIDIFNVSNTLSCSLNEVTYEPLDMRGFPPTTEVTIAACQAKCSIVPGCAHFAYWLASGSCHVQDAFAYRTYNRLGFISGPAGCSTNEQSLALLAILMRKRTCYDVDAVRSPYDMHALTPRRKATVLDCQRWCFFMPGCRYFTYNTLSDICHLEGPNVTLTRGMQGYVSGPKCCGCPSVLPIVIGCLDYSKILANFGCMTHLDQAIRQAVVLSIGMMPFININNVGQVMRPSKDGVQDEIMIYPPSEIPSTDVREYYTNPALTRGPGANLIDPTQAIDDALSNTDAVARHIKLAIMLVPGIKKYLLPHCSCVSVEVTSGPQPFIDSVQSEWEARLESDDEDSVDGVDDFATKVEAQAQKKEVVTSLLSRVSGAAVVALISATLVAFFGLSSLSAYRSRRQNSEIDIRRGATYSYGEVGRRGAPREAGTGSLPSQVPRTEVLLTPRDASPSGLDVDNEGSLPQLRSWIAPSAREFRPGKGVTANSAGNRPKFQGLAISMTSHGDPEPGSDTDEEHCVQPLTEEPTSPATRSDGDEPRL